MAVAYRSSSTAGDEFQGSSRAPAVPAGAAAGDVVIVFVERWGGNPAITAPSGFADWGTTYTSGDAASNIHVFWKRLTGADTGSYTFSWTGTLWSHAQAICMTGVIASGTPIEAANGWAGTAGTYGSTSVTTATIPGLIWKTYNDSSGTHTPPTGFTEVQDNDCGSLAYRIGTATGSQTASGGTVTSSSPATAVLIALSPAAGGGSSSAAANTATESDASQPLGKRKLRAVGLASQPNTALTVGRSKARGATLAAETDAALGFTRSKRKSALQASSAEAALPVGRVRSRTSGTALELEQALPIGKRKVKATGFPAEADTALAVGYVSGTSQPISTATSTEVALAIGHRRSKAIGTVLELDTAGEASFINPAWRLVMPAISERYPIKGNLAVTISREATVFGDEDGLFTTESGSPAEGTDEYGAIPFGTKYIWYGGHVNTTDDPAVKALWLAHGFEVENVQL